MFVFKYLKNKMKEQDQNSSNSSGGVFRDDKYISVPNVNRYIINDILNKEEKIKKKLKLTIILLKELLLFLIILLSFIKYKNALKTPEQAEKDFDMDPSFFMDLIYNCFFSAVLTTLALFFIQFKICKKYQVFIIIIRYLLFFIMNTGQNLDAHGSYNTIVFLIFIVIGEFILLIMYGFKRIYQKRKAIAISLILSIVVFSIIIYTTKIEDKVKCKNWEYGLNNTKIDNNKKIYPCEFIIPNHNCFLNFLGPAFDFSRGKTCLKRSEDDKNKLKAASTSKYINKETKRIGYPITTHRINFNLNKQQNAKNLYKEVMDNLVDMDNAEQLKLLGKKEEPEVVLDFTNNEYGEVKININFDEELSKQRKKAETDTKPLYNNIIFIFFDGVSRSHFGRIFKKTSRFLNKFLKYEGISNDKDPSQRYHGFQFLKQHSLAEFTLGNAIPMFYGAPFYSKNIESINGEIKEKGFVTCNICGLCDKSVYYFDWRLKEGMKRNFIEFDHEMFALNCDPNYFDVVNPHSIGIGESSVFRRCLYGRENIEYLFDYGKKFFETYSDNRKYLRMSIPNGHELSGQVIKYVDDPLYDFLNYLFVKDLLKNTAVILAADHGLNILVLYKLFQSQDQEIELSNPLLYLILSDKKGMSYEEQYENLRKNQQTFTTSYDIYHTLKHIINGYDKPITTKSVEKQGEFFNPKTHFLGTSLFNKINKKERFCSNYIDIQECICKPY